MSDLSKKILAFAFIGVYACFFYLTSDFTYSEKNRVMLPFSLLAGALVIVDVVIRLWSRRNKHKNQRYQ